MATIVKFAVKNVNPALLAEELKPLGITGITFVGFVSQTRDRMVPVSSRTQYASSRAGGQTTLFFADPGELHLEAPSDPGTPLDTALSAHNSTGRSTGQQEQDDDAVDRAIVQAAVDAAGSLSADEIKAMARIVLKS